MRNAIDDSVARSAAQGTRSPQCSGTVSAGCAQASAYPSSCSWAAAPASGDRVAATVTVTGSSFVTTAEDSPARSPAGAALTGYTAGRSGTGSAVGTSTPPIRTESPIDVWTATSARASAATFQR